MPAYHKVPVLNTKGVRKTPVQTVEFQQMREDVGRQLEAFGVEPRLEHSAFFRPHNRSEDLHNLYLVGASAQPGAGTPSVMMSAKMTARAILEDHGVQFQADQGADEATEERAAK